ncbi:MAG: CHAP domain-containing protein [Ktedonobacterales bacterium]
MLTCSRMYASLLPTGVAALLFAALALVLGGCSLQALANTRTTATPTRPAFAPGGLYVNPALEFSITVPADWMVEQQYGLRQLPHTAAVTLVDTKRSSDQININVTEGTSAVEAFAARGTAPSHVGSFPAFIADSSAPSAQGLGPCLIRIFLAGNDYVVGQWCGADAFSHASEFEEVLATYRPASSGVTSLISTAPVSPYVVSQPVTCPQLVAAAAEAPADTSNWGRQQALPTDPRWAPYPLPGASVCSNFVYVNGQPEGYPGYSFQCTELANRFLAEQWGHGPLDGNAETYFDYYDSSGAFHPGSARVYPDTELSSDGDQGTSSFAPTPGDLLVFQDVQDGTSWTSGLIPGSDGHVAVITAVTSTQVYMMQQNFSDSLYYMALPITQVATGWHITDNVSGVTGRIVRGWIHFSENTSTGNAGLPAAVLAQDAFAIGADQDLYDYQWVSGIGWQPALDVRASITPTPALVPLTGVPSTNVYQLAGTTHESVFVIGNDGQLYEYWWRVSDGWHLDNTSSISPPPAGVTWTGSPSAFTYTNPADSLLHHSVFLLGNDGHLYYYDWVETATWAAPVDISGAPPVAWSGPPSAFGWVEDNTEYQAVYIIGNDGHLYEYSSTDGVIWSIEDVTASSQTALPAGVRPTGTASGYAFTPSGESVPRRSIFVTGSDGHLYNYNWVQGASSGGTWDLTDVSADVSSGPAVGTSNVTLIGSPGALYVPSGTSDLFQVYETGSDGHLYQYTYQNSGWTVVDVSAESGQPGATQIASAPSAFTTPGAGGAGNAGQMETICAVTSDGQLAIFTYQPSATPVWTFTEQSAPPGTSLVGSLPSGLAYG